MTFKELQDACINEVFETYQAVGMTTTRVKSALNRAQTRVAAKGKILEKQFTKTTVANQASYTDSGWDVIQEIRGVRLQDGTEYGLELLPFPGGYNNLPREYEYSSSPGYFWAKYPNTGGTTLEIGTWPIYNTASDTLLIEAVYAPADMSADGDVCEVKDVYCDLVWMEAAEEILRQYQNRFPSLRNQLRDLGSAKREMYVALFDSNRTAQAAGPVETVDVYG